jgi:hypothetical protein
MASEPEIRMVVLVSFSLFVMVCVSIFSILR